MAQAVFTHLVRSKGLETHFEHIESGGTSAFHEGDDPDPRTVEVCRANKIPIDSFGQQVTKEHFYKFTHLLAMDANNLKNLKRMAPPDATAKIELFGDYGGNGKSIDDPYYGGGSGFQRAFKQCTEYSNAFLQALGLE